MARRQLYELPHAQRYYARACALSKGRCSRHENFVNDLERACANEDDSFSCHAAAMVLSDMPGSGDRARIVAHAEKACDLGPRHCHVYLPLDPARHLTVLEVGCIESKLVGGDCVSLRTRLAEHAGVQRGPDDWLPLLSEAAEGGEDPRAICGIDPTSCGHAWPTIPPQAQAIAQRNAILAEHEGRCKAGELAHCEALVRIDALGLAGSFTAAWRNQSAPHRFNHAVEWERLCRAGMRWSCLSRGLLMDDEAAFRRACELGEPLGCTHAAGAALARNDRTAARAWLAQACRLGRAWACR
jgi:hypothetical protein